MSRYFHISNGLRGCYMPDSAYVLRADTRRELKAALESEASYMRDSYSGASKAAVASLAALAWREYGKPAGTRAYLPFALPLSPLGASERARGSYGLFCGIASRTDWLESQESDS